MKKIKQQIAMSGFLGLVTLLVFSACSPVETEAPSPIPTLDASFNRWQEYSSEFTYSSIDTLETGFLKYRLRYPPGWYIYPGSTTGETYIQNFERIGIDLEAEPQVAGTVKLIFSALPCKHSMDSCPTGLPELAPGLPGAQEVDAISDETLWVTSLYTRGFVIYISAHMIGTPEENAELIKTLNKLLSTFVVYDGGLFPPSKTPTPGPTYPVRPLPSAYP